MEKLKSKINRLLKNKQGIRVSDLKHFAKERGIDPKLVNLALNQCFPFIQNKPWITKKPSRAYLTTRVTSLGSIQCDIGYFNKVPPFKKPANIKAFIIFIDILSRRIWLEIIYNSRGAEDVLNSMKRFLERYKREFKKYPFSLTSDMEGSLTSKRVMSFFNKNNIELLTLENSLHKCYFCENYINQLKRLYFMLINDTNKKNEKKPMYKMLPILENALNGRFIIIDGHMTKFKPKNLNFKNYKQFLKTACDLNPALEYSSYTYRCDGYNFGFETDNLVYIKLNDIQTGKQINDRLSTRSISKKVFKIKKLFLYAAKDMKLTPGAICEQVYPKMRNKISKNKFFFNTSSLVLVPNSKRKEVLKLLK